MIHNSLFNSRILVTGATGFVGSHLTEKLVNLGARVTATTHHPINPNSYFATQKLEKKCKMIQIELTDFTSVRNLLTNNKQPTTNNYFDFIFHLAAQPIVDIAYKNPKTTLYSNILGTINILECARLSNHIKGIIVASSDKAYGKKNPKSEIRNPNKYLNSTTNRKYNIGLVSNFNIRDSNLKYIESDPLAGDHPYEVSKSATDLIAHSYFKTYNLPIVITRFGNIYGEGDIHFSRLIPGIIKAVICNKTFEIRSDGKFVRDYLYVKDVVSGYLLIAKNVEKVCGEAFNLGSEETLNVIELIKLMEKVLSQKIKYKIHNNQKNEIPYQSLDYTKIRRSLGWKPKYSLEKTIRNIFTWYENNL
jgi:CDP-glucose 4,6-dehydratase